MLEVLRSDESLQIDEILELLETQLTSSEVFTALFELEMAGRIRCLAGKELRAHNVSVALSSITNFGPARDAMMLHISECLRVYQCERSRRQESSI